MKQRSVLSSVLMLLFALAVVAPAQADRAQRARVDDLRIISGGSRPLGACLLEDWKSWGGWLAASPADPRRLTATWTQGVRTADGQQSKTAMWTTSIDSGATWTIPQPVPGLTTCTGNTAPLPQTTPTRPDFADDPVVSFGVDGVAYLGSVHVTTRIPLVCCGDVLISRSADGGLHWDTPVVVDEPSKGRKDFPFVTADPGTPARAYLAWNHLTGLQIKFSSTTDGGVTWSPGTVVDEADPGHSIELRRPGVVVLPDSSLLVFYSDVLLTAVGASDSKVVVPGVTTSVERVVRSEDGGVTWSAPTAVVETAYPACRNSHQSVTAAPDGRVYMAWADSCAGKVMIVRSADGGGSWSPPTTVANGPGAQLATIAADRRGTIGITWYDNRNLGPGKNTDVWFAHSRDHGATWNEIHLAGPFDLNTSGFPATEVTAPLGFYEGLVATPHGFAAAFLMAKPQATTGPNDVFFASIALDRK